MPTASVKLSRQSIVLPLILFLAFTLRVWGVWFGLPHLYHADEPIVVNHALAFGSGDLNPHFFRIPPLVSYLLFGVYVFFYFAGFLTGVFHSTADLEALFYTNPTPFYLLARGVFGVLMGTLTVYTLYTLIQKFRGQTEALVAAFFLAISFLHVRDSHYVYADIPLVLALTLTFFPILIIASSQGDSSVLLKQSLITGLGAGIAMAFKYNGVFVLAAFGSSLVCSVRFSVKKWLLPSMTVALVALGTFFILNPFALLDHAYFFQEIAAESAVRKGGTLWFHHLAYSLLGAAGGPLILISVLGLFSMLFEKKTGSHRIAIPLLTFFVFYYLILIRFGQYYDRYVLPLIPVLCWFAAAGVIRTSEIFKAKYRKALLAAAVLITSITPLTKSILCNSIFAYPDVRTEALLWFQKNIPAGSRVAMEMPFYMPRLSFDESRLKEKLAALEKESFSKPAQVRRLKNMLYEEQLNPRGYDLYFLSETPSDDGFLFSRPQLSYNWADLQKKGIEYVLIAGVPHTLEAREFIAQLKANAHSLKTFSPYSAPERTEAIDPYALTGAPFLLSELLLRKANGQPIEVFQIPLKNPSMQAQTSSEIPLN